MAGQLELSLRGRARTLSVTQLVRVVRETLEAGLDACWVVGEVSNVRLAPSGHLYFTLKDADSAISVVMFRTAAARLRFRVTDGTEVVMHGRVDLYETRGALQFYADEMEPRGLGALQLAFEQLKQRLGREGLFDRERKRALPMLPGVIGVVTARGGAGLRDIVTVLLARYPNLHLIIRPARVQGAGAAREIARAIDDLNEDGRAQVLIVGRGGGSLEDLWAFNEEAVARAIHRSRIPVVSAVGHEIDYTIADFVADVRAPTPTAAAQLVVPAKAELRQRVDEAGATLHGAIVSALTGRRRAAALLRGQLREPRAALRQARQRADEAAVALEATMAARLGERRRQVAAMRGRLGPPGAMAREMRHATRRTALHLAQAQSQRLARAWRPRLNARRRAGARSWPPSVPGSIRSRRSRCLNAATPSLSMRATDTRSPTRRKSSWATNSTSG